MCVAGVFVCTFELGDDAFTKRVLDSAYTSRIGRFEEDAQGYLTYHLYYHGADTVQRIFGIRFYSAVGRKLADDLCDTVSCPDICFRWTLSPIDSATADAYKPVSCHEAVLEKIRAGIHASIEACIADEAAGLRAEYAR